MSRSPPSGTGSVVGHTDNRVQHLPGTGHHTPASGHHTPGSGHHTPGTGHQSPTSGHHTPSSGYQSPVSGSHTLGAGHSPTAGHSPISAAGFGLKIQPGIKQTLGLKESPQPALDVPPTGLNQNSPGRPSVMESIPNITKSEAAILSQVGLSPGHRNSSSFSSALTNHVNLTKEKQHGDNGGKKSSSGASKSKSSERLEKSQSKSPVKRPGSSTPIAQLYPELAEKLERTRSKPDVKSKGEVKNKSGQKNSRTMNRLQTKIAQNKIKDKLKKNGEKGPTPLAMSLPNALTKEVAPNVTITPEMSALQAQLLSALPRRTGENRFPFTSMGNMAPLMNKLGPGGESVATAVGGGGGGGRQQPRHPGPDRSRLPPPPYPYPHGVVPPSVDVSTAAASLAAAAAAAAAKTAEKQAACGGSDGMRSPASSTSSRLGGGGVSPHHQHPHTAASTSATSPSASVSAPFPYSSVPSSQHTVTSPRDSRCNMLPSTAVSSSTSHSILGLPPPHPAPHLLGGGGGGGPPALHPAALRGKHCFLTPGSLATGQPTIPVRAKRRRDVLSEQEARRTLKRHSAVKLYAYHASQRLNSKDILPLGKKASLPVSERSPNILTN